MPHFRRTAPARLLPIPLLLAALATAFVATFSAPAEAQEPRVQGHLTVNGERVELPHVYLTQQKDPANEEDPYDEEERKTKILFAAEAIAERDLASWSHGDFAFVQIVLVGPVETPLLGKLEMGGDTQVFQNLKLSKDHTLLSGGARPQVLIESNSGRFAGRVWLEQPAKHRDDTYQYDFTFSVPMAPE